MGAAEILDGLSKLSPAELALVQQRLLELEGSYVIDPSAEFSAAIDEGLRSLRTEPTLTVEEVRREIAGLGLAEDSRTRLSCRMNGGI
jgi:hypothetical protein